MPPNPNRSCAPGSSRSNGAKPVRRPVDAFPRENDSDPFSPDSFSPLLGIAFGVGRTPCIGPILGGILTVAATSSGALSGTGLLATYAAGLAIPFLAAAAFTDRFSRALTHLRCWGRWLHPVSGANLIVIGLAMMAGQLTALAYWLLEAFPVLGGLG